MRLVKSAAGMVIMVISAVWLCSCVDMNKYPERSQDLRARFPIVTGGKACAVIVTPDTPSAVVKYAAGELQSHVEQATKVRLDIIPEKQAATNSLGHIYLGPCAETEKAGIHPSAMKLNSFRVKITPAALFLAGRDGTGAPPQDDVTPMGTLFAVYDWLETQAGVKWLWPGKLGTVVPHMERLAGGPEQDRTVFPPFLTTNLRYGEFGNWRGVISEAAYNQYIYDTAVWLRRHRLARPVSFSYGHAYTKYWGRFGKTHPEFFAMRPDGKREPLDGNVDLVQMCVSNPNFHRQVIADWLEQRKTYPSLPWINGMENDKRAEDPPCACAQCKAWDPKNPESAIDNPYAAFGDPISAVEKSRHISLSDRYAKFYLALQAEGRKHDPDATVAGMAYADYVKPPLETRLNDHIFIRIVPPYRFPMSDKTVQAVLCQWDGWAKTGARLLLRPNYFLDGYCMPYIFAHQFGEQFKHAWKNGMCGTDISSLTSMWGTQGPNLYMLGRIHERPDLEVNAILDEYYSGFGPAAKAVRAYFEYWEDVTTKGSTEAFYNAHPEASWNTFYRAADKIYTPEALAKGFQLLDAAAKAAGQDSESLARVEFLRKGLKHAELAIRTTMAFQAFQNKPEEDTNLLDAYHKALQELDAYRKNIEKDHVVNLVFLNWEENRTWDREQVQMMGNYEKIAPLPLFWSFQWDPREIGRTEKWFTESLDTSNWLRARTDKWWEDQEVGEKWKQQSGKDYDGLAWYRAAFTVPAKAKGRKLRLLFGAVDEGAVIWVNGQQLLERKYNEKVDPDSWKKPFTVDITPIARFDAPNVVAVQVEDRSGKGGIYRAVALVAE